MKIIFVEGNIGSGKTTALDYLEKEYPQAIYVREPVESWQSLPTTPSIPTSQSYSESKEFPTEINLLEAFYQDRKKYGFCFQTYTFITKTHGLFEAIKLAQKQKIETVVCERSMFTDRDVFVESLYENGLIDLNERTTYENIWVKWLKTVQPQFVGLDIEFLYIRCTPKQLISHIRDRGRKEEANQIPVNYLESLHQKHDGLYYPESGDFSQLQEYVNFLLDRSDYHSFTIKVIHNDKQQKDFLDSLDEWFNY